MRTTQLHSLNEPCHYRKKRGTKLTRKKNKSNKRKRKESPKKLIIRRETKRKRRSRMWLTQKRGN